MEKVRRLSGERSKTRAIVAAMETFVKSKGQEELLGLQGKIHLDYDWKSREEEELSAQLQREGFLERR